MYTTNVQGQDFSALTVEAEHLYNVGNYDEAIIACERYLYFNSYITEREKILFLEAKAFQQKGDFETSSNILLSIPQMKLDSHMLYLVNFNLALNSYLLSRYDEAQVFLEDCDTANITIAERKNYELLCILIYCEMGNWEKAQKVVVNSSCISDSKKTSLIHLFDNKPLLLDQHKLEWYSRFVPGSGQFFAGYYVEGSINFIFCASALALGTFLVINGYYISGYFIGAGLIYAFYNGGLRRLKQIVETENISRKKAFIERLKQTLQE
jgi:tetratricopeptide (TPR) repeat protein